LRGECSRRCSSRLRRRAPQRTAARRTSTSTSSSVPPRAPPQSPWTRLVLPLVLSGHVSSFPPPPPPLPGAGLRGADGRARGRAQASWRTWTPSPRRWRTCWPQRTGGKWQTWSTRRSSVPPPFLPPPSACAGGAECAGPDAAPVCAEVSGRSGKSVLQRLMEQLLVSHDTLRKLQGGRGEVLSLDAVMRNS